MPGWARASWPRSRAADAYDCPMGRKGWILVVIVVLGCGLGAGALLVDRQRMVSLEPGDQTLTVTIGQTHTAEFTLRNDHPWRSARVEYAKAQCGCFRVGEAPEEIGPGESKPLTIEIFIDPRGDRVNNTLRVYLVGGDRVTAGINADPIAPFGGWPVRAEGAYDEQSRTAFIEIAEVYRDKVTLVQAFAGEGVPVETIYDGGTIVLVDPPAGAELSITFQTEEGEVAWEGTLVDERNREPVSSS